MDSVLFFTYLKWRKEKTDGFFTKLRKLPIKAIMLIVGMIICVAVVLLLFNQCMEVVYIAAAIELILCIISMFYSERIYIDRSEQDYKDYKDYCKEFYKWLVLHDYPDKKSISKLKNRIYKKQIDINSKIEKSRERIDKWLQILLIPIVLSIIGSIFNNQYGMDTKLIYTTAIVIVFVSIYMVLLGADNISNVFYNMRESQYQSFINDLQGVLHIMFSGNDNSENDPKEQKDDSI